MSSLHVDLNALPTPVRQAVTLLAEEGEPGWLVGGATRDLLLGRPVKDFDLVIKGDGLRWARRVADRVGGAFVRLDDERGVGRVVVTHEGKPLWIDIARFRGAEEGPGAPTLEEDLRLRDFTVNAIAIAPITGDLVDPTGGVADLEAGVLRMTGPEALRADPLRVLRAVRLHATHGFDMEPATQEAMRAAAPALRNVAAERVLAEWLRVLAPRGAMERVERLDDLGVLEVVLPELLLGKGVTQPSPHSHDVYGHNLLVLDAIEVLLPWNDDRTFWGGAPEAYQESVAEHLREEIAFEMPRWLLLKHVSLLHDIGKPATRSVDKKGRIHFYRHEMVGAKMIRDVMRRMKFPSRAIQYGERVIRHHLRPLQLSQYLPPSNRAIYRFFRDVGSEGPDIALHSIADQRGKAFAKDREEVVEVVARLFQAFFHERERFVQPRPLLDGNDVMDLTGQRGPVIGKILERLREQQAQRQITTREEAERFVRQWKSREDDATP